MVKVEKFQGENPNVIKFVFVNDEKGLCYEAVLYKYPTYEERTVLCVSVQCGCPVGCTFCGTGKQFIKNLSKDEIIDQVYLALKSEGIEDINSRCAKFQIMFMSMGEPFLNYYSVQLAIRQLNMSFANADLLVSTIAPANTNGLMRFIDLSKAIDKIGLQFSVHKAFDDERDELIPYKNKLDLKMLRNYGLEWWKATGRKPYINYCIDGTNNGNLDFDRLHILFPPNVFCFTFSVVCSADETMKDAGYRELNSIKEFEQKFIEAGYDTRIFDPAGQDDIGGGCGQLWYVQDYLKGIKNARKD